MQAMAIVGVTAVMLCALVPTGVAREPALQTVQAEPSLEPEFKQLRDRLGALPEFRGDDAASNYRLAEELARRGDVAGAIDRYRAALALQPEWGEAYRGLGQVLLDHHDYADAVEALQAAVRLGPPDHQTFYWLGRAQMGTGQLDAAAGSLTRALELKPEDAETAADLGLLRMAQGDAAKAEEALNRSIRLKPDYAEAHRLRDQLMKAKPDPDAVRRAGRAVLNDIFGRE